MTENTSVLGYLLIHHLFDFSYLMVSESKNNAPISQKKKRYSPFFFIRSPTPEIESPFTYRYQETEGEANFIKTDGREMSQLVEHGGPEPGTKIQFRGSPRLFIKGYCRISVLSTDRMQLDLYAKGFPFYGVTLTYADSAHF